MYLASQVNPIVGSIEHTAYISPSGDDTNSGEIDAPIKTFAEALNRFPFGENGLTSYSEVIFLPGNYSILEEIRQPCYQYFNGSGFKSVSIRGTHQDSVILDGSLAQVISGNFIELLGSGISIKDLTITLANATDTASFWAAIDFYSSINTCSAIPTSDILIENIIIDGTWDHGINLDQVANVLVKNCTIRNTNLTNIYGRNDNGTTITWGSGIKTRLSSNLEIAHCKVHNCWGEGIATSRSTDTYVHHNEVADNYSVNIYLDNVINGVYTNNFCPSTSGDSTFWRGGGPSPGFGIAAEHYPSNNLDRTENVRIYNNIILNTQGVYFDDNRHAGEPKIVDLKNIWFCHNNIIGWDGDVATNLRMIRIDYADYNAGNLGLDSIFLFNNIIAVGEDFFDPLGNTQITSGSNVALPPTLFFGNNYWSHDPRKFAFFNYPYHEDSDTINSQIPTYVTPENINLLIPNTDNLLCMKGLTLPFVDTDFLDQTRFSPPNVGALRKGLPTGTTTKLPLSSISIFPNPSTGMVFISMQDAPIGVIKIFDPSGKKMVQYWADDAFTSLRLDHIPKGWYWIKLKDQVFPIVLH